MATIDQGISGALPQAAGLSPTVEPASSLDGSATSIPDAGVTPGPWHYVEWDSDPRVNEDGNRYWGVGPEKFHRGALYLEASGWMTEANARLIAAAPELLEACQKARIKLSRYREQHGDLMIGGVAAEYDAVVRVIDAAIAKAMGA